MSKQVIAFDLDDVLAESTESWRVYINELTGANVLPEDFRDPGEYWGYYESVWKKHRIDHLITIAQLDEILENGRLHLRAYEGASKVLNHLKQRFDVAVVTARASNQEAHTREWLQANFPDLFDTLVVANGQRGVALTTKGDICKQIGAQWMVDDNPNHCNDALKAGVTPLLFGEFGWQYAASNNIVRVKDWAAVKEYFDGIG